jgi:predicted nucleic acid-binding protein
MRILIDTNILIHREDPTMLPENLQKLLRIIRENKHVIIVHPASIQDIENDTDAERRKVMISKLKSYPLLESPPAADRVFLSMIGKLNANEEPDNTILCAVYKNAVDILITEDRGILGKALKVGIEDRVMNIDSAVGYFESLHKNSFSHVMLKEEHVYNISVNDSIFDSLREEYPEFEEWFNRISRGGRKCWVYPEKGETRAILIYKEEDEPVDAAPSLPKRRRFKIATLKVDLTGYKIGELLLKLAFKYCVDHNIDETYLTHFTEEEDYVVDLILEFGFVSCGKNKRGETVYLKKLHPDEYDIDPVKMSRIFYPSFRDGIQIQKFVVPIIPKFHDRLFQDYRKRQMRITEYFDLNPQGNTIKKAYLSHSRIRKIHPGDIVLFYRSRDQHSITSLGVVEEVYSSLDDENEILRLVGRRTVYTHDEIREMVGDPVTVIIFRHHFHFQNPLCLDELIADKILGSAPQSIIEISHRKYDYVKRRGGIHERFAFN